MPFGLYGVVVMSHVRIMAAYIDGMIIFLVDCEHNLQALRSVLQELR